MKEVQNLPTFQTTVLVSTHLLISLFTGLEHTLWNFSATVKRPTHFFFRESSHFLSSFLLLFLYSLQVVYHAVESLLFLVKDCEENCRRLCEQVSCASLL